MRIVARLFVTAFIVALAGCTSGVAGDSRQGATAVCASKEDKPDVVAATTFTGGADFVLQRVERLRSDRTYSKKDEIVIGTPCALAKDGAACRAKVDELHALTACSDTPRKTPGFSFDLNGECALTSFVFTRGDEVGIATKTEEVARLLGPIDTIDKAVLLAGRSDRGAAECFATPPPQFKQTASGWLIVYAHTDCEKSERDDVSVEVDRDGTIREISRTVLESSVACGD